MNDTHATHRTTAHYANAQRHTAAPSMGIAQASSPSTFAPSTAQPRNCATAQPGDRATGTGENPGRPSMRDLTQAIAQAPVKTARINATRRTSRPHITRTQAVRRHTAAPSMGITQASLLSTIPFQHRNRATAQLRNRGLEPQTSNLELATHATVRSAIGVHTPRNRYW